MPRWTSILIVVAVMAAACGVSSDDFSDEGRAQPRQLECEREGYPCSLAEVPTEILERSDALGDDALAMLESGASGDEVAAWLEDQEGMVEVDFDEQAIRFRLDGGRGTWLFRRAAFGTRATPGAGTMERPLAGPPPAPTFHITGPDSKDKRARVLSPFLFDFGDLDEGPTVSAILAGTRGYEGRVESAANRTPTESNVNIESYRGWDKLEVVHVATHGSTLCKKNRQPPCRTVVAASTLQGAAPQREDVIVKAGRLNRPDRGLDVGKAERPRGLDLDQGPPDPNRFEFVLLTADFFSNEYPSGLDDTFVFINACELFRVDSDIANALRGRKGAFLGWDETVSSLAAFGVADALYRDLSDEGHPIEVAYADLRNRGLDVDPHLDEHAKLILAGRRDLDDMHIRDVVELLDPASRELMTPDTSIPILGTQGDGEEDSIPYLIQVDGIKPEFAADATVHFSLDGTEVDPQPLSNGTVDDDDRWLIGGEAPLGFDLEEATTMAFRAWVELDSGGESEDESTATVVGEEPIMGLKWVMEGRSDVNLETGGALESSARLILEFEKGQAFDEPHPRYVVTGGTVTYADRNVSALGCDYSGGGQTYDVTPQMSPPNPAPPSAPSVLVFDTTVTPVRYHGIIYTSGGPDRIVTQVCHSERDSITNDINYGNHVTWMFLDPSHAEPVTERRLIEGADVVATGHYLFYTLTRVE